MQTSAKTFLLCSAMTALAACGGGGGSDNEPSYSGSTKTVTVTNRASADTVVNNTLCVLFTCGADGGTPRTGMTLSRAADANGLFRSSPSACPQGGSKTVTETDDDYYSVGHRATVEYDQCQYGLAGGVLLDGSYSSELIAVSGTPFESVEWSFTHRGQYDRYRFDVLDGSGRSHGYMHSHGDVVSTYRSGSGELDKVVDNSYPEIYTESDFGVPMETLVRNGRQLTESSSTSDRIVTAQQGGLCSTHIGGCVTLGTTTNFNFPNGFAFAPDAGQMVITAADNAKVCVTIIDATQVTIKYDVDPVDGTYEDSKTTTWDAL